MSESIAVTLITVVLGGFISIITILLKYRIENNNTMKSIQKSMEKISDNDKMQDSKIENLTLQFLKESKKTEEKYKNLEGSINELNFSFSKFTNSQQLQNKIIAKYINLGYSLGEVVVNDIQSGEHDGDLIRAKEKIEGFKNLIDSEEFSDFLGGKNG